MDQNLYPKISRLLTAVIVAVLIVLPFHAFITVGLSSIVGHYTELRLWKEVLLMPVVMGSMWMLWRDKVLRQGLVRSQLTWLIGGFVGVQFIIGIIAYLLGTVSVKVLAYGWLLDMRFVLFFMLVAVVTARYDWLRQNWRQILFIPASVVVFFGLLQVTVLPVDFLEHVGYGPHTIEPYATINQNEQYVRILSTLRGPNPLGAYLALIISALAVVLLLSKSRLQAKHVVLSILSGVVLFFSFSRSAWLGSGISLCAAIWLHFRNIRARKVIMGGLAAVAITGLALVTLLSDNRHVDNLLFHTEDSTTVVSSNEARAHVMQEAVRDVVQEPFGKGPGSAGPASVYNEGGVRISENFFLQIGQEVGWLGLALFILINVLVGWLLWQRKHEPLCMALFVSLLGLTFINLVSHAWSDDTLCYLWWGLAGTALAPLLVKEYKPLKRQKKP